MIDGCVAACGTEENTSQIAQGRCVQIPVAWIEVLSLKLAMVSLSTDTGCERLYRTFYAIESWQC
jgi:hypothetical protein